MPVSHAVEEHPVFVLRAVFHKRDVMTGFDAEHGKKLHLLARDLLAAPRAPAVKLFWNVQPVWLVRFASVVGVNLRRDDRVVQLSGQNRTWPAGKRSVQGSDPQFIPH